MKNQALLPISLIGLTVILLTVIVPIPNLGISSYQLYFNIAGILFVAYNLYSLYSLYKLHKATLKNKLYRFIITFRKSFKNVGGKILNIPINDKNELIQSKLILLWEKNLKNPNSKLNSIISERKRLIKLDNVIMIIQANNEFESILSFISDNHMYDIRMERKTTTKLINHFEEENMKRIEAQIDERKQKICDNLDDLIK